MSDCANPDNSYDTTTSYDDSYDTESYDSSYDTEPGIVATESVDIDGDGIDDALISTDSQGGQHMGLDLDGDGQLDTMVSDTDGDGIIDAVSQDTDGDGQLDTQLDPETGEPIDGTDDGDDPFVVDETTTDDDSGEDVDDDPDVHGDPMEEIPYHQAQVGPNDCLPTSVAMVLSEVTGAEVPQGDVVDLANELGLLSETGMSLEGGLQLLDHYGVEAEVQSGTVDDLRTMLDNGDQIIIGLDSDDLYGQGDAPFADDLVAGHAVVITGIDDEAGVVYINDPGFPDGAGVAISIEAFEDAWADSGSSMIVAEAADTEADDDSAGSAGSASPFGTGDDSDDSIFDTIKHIILMPFNLKIA